MKVTNEIIMAFKRDFEFLKGEGMEFNCSMEESTPINGPRLFRPNEIIAWRSEIDRSAFTLKAMVAAASKTPFLNQGI